MLLAGAGAAQAAGKNIQIGPNGKLSSDKHTITVAAKVKCKDDGKLGVATKVKQGDNVGKGTTSVQCKKGETRTVTVGATKADATFTTGAATACAATAKNTKRSSGSTCKDINVIT
jgi:hypothetical protein